MLTYSDNEKAAIVSLLIEMVNVDDTLAPEELNEINLINDELHITQDTFDLGKALDFQYAVEVASYLTRIIDSDGIVHPVELQLLNRICKQTGLDIILLRKNK